MANTPKAAIHSMRGALAFSGILTNQNKLMAGALQDNFKLNELEDGEGNTIAVEATGRNHTATFEIIPIAADGTRASARANIKLPDALALVTISGTDPGSYLDGDWNYVGGGSIEPSTDGWLRVKLPCKRWSPTTGGTPGAFLPMS